MESAELSALAEELFPNQREEAALATRALLAFASGEEDAELVAAARRGHSPSARALVNASDVVPVLAAAVEASILPIERSEAPRGEAPRGDARPRLEELGDRILASAKARISTSNGSAAEAAPKKPRALAEILADQHAVSDEDVERRARIAAFGASGVLGGADEKVTDALIGDLLDRMAPFLPPAAIFVSVVRGPQTIHRVNRGFPAAFGNVDIVPRHLSFCTHAVSAGRTFVVHDAAREAFFRRSTVATQFSARTYVGVPLRVPSTSAAEPPVAVGALCAIEFAPPHGPVAEHRLVPRGQVAFFELCARHAEALVAKRDVHEFFDDGLYAESFFRELLRIEVERHADDPTHAPHLSLVAEGEAHERAAFYGRLSGAVAKLSMSGDGVVPPTDVDGWIARARA